MSNLTENTIEQFAIKLLEKLGYHYIYAPDIAPDGEKPERKSYEDVLLVDFENPENNEFIVAKIDERRGASKDG